jgi:hypothetical protein
VMTAVRPVKSGTSASVQRLGAAADADIGRLLRCYGHLQCK